MAEKATRIRTGTEIALGKATVKVGRGFIKARRAMRELGEDISNTNRNFEIARNDKYLERARNNGWIGRDETNRLGQYLDAAEKRTAARAKRKSDRDDAALEYLDKIESGIGRHQDALKHHKMSKKTNKIELVGPGIIKVGRSK